MPDKNVRKATSDIDLRLSGDKIKLETRPSGRDSRASSKCSMLSSGPSRPVSAIPMLTLYNNKEDYDYNLDTRRPVSAPFQSNNSNALKTIQGIDGKLPSTDLLKTLLSQPISTWKRDYDKQKVNEEKSLDDLSTRSISTSSEQSLGTKIQEVAQNGFAKINEPIKVDTFDSAVLMPGVTGKPPLPRKKDDKGESRKPTKKTDALINYSNYTDDIKDSINFDYTKESYDDVLISNEKCFVGLEMVPVDNTSDYESRGSTSESNYETLDNATIQYQNWIFDENEVKKRENETDIYLKSLKKQNEEIQDLIKKSELALEKDTMTHKELVYETKEEDDFDLKFDKFFRKETAQASDDTPEKNETNPSIKNVIKPMKANNPKKLNPIINKKPIDGNRPKKFVATPMRHYKEYQEKDMSDIESWMSQSKQTGVSIANPKSNYAEVMDSLKELEEVVKGEEIVPLDEVPVLDNKIDNKLDEEEQQYDDIASILEVLEAQDKLSQKKIESIKEIVTTELSTNDSRVQKPKQFAKESLESRAPSQVKTTSNKSQNTEVKENVSSTSLASTNYNHILSFLDEVERNSCKTLSNAKERVSSVTKLLETTINLDTVPKLDDLLTHNNEELSKEIIDLTLRLKDKSSSIKLLQDELSLLRNQIMKMTKQTDEVVKLKLKSQKDEFESIVKRHQKFIDQLIADKTSLNQQCEGLLNEMKVQEDRHNSNLKAIEHKHKVELQKVKDMQMAGEKIRRERWIDNKTQKIKELTVKSIEPELQNMTSRHQQEIADLRSLHKREIEDLELRAARKTQQQCELLREQLTMEREKAIAHEREILRQRYDAMVESEEKGYQEQRRRLQQEHANRIMECEERETLCTTERDRAIKQAQDEFNDKLQATIRRHNNEVKLLKEKTELEMETWKTNYVKQQNVQLTEKEVQIREYYRKERDREIENVIERLENEACETKKQIEQTTENRIRRIREKYENEIRDLEISEKDSKSKFNNIKSKLLEAENIVLNLTSNVKHLEQQLRDSQEIAKKLNEDRSRMKEIVQDEIKEDVSKMLNEIQALKDDKEKEMEQVYARVRVTVARKDELLAELTRDHAALQEKCTYLENMLEQQRKDYLMK